jgi:DNA-binding PadR family transcriptional regulator
VSRSSLYTTLDRLEQKQLVRWKVALGGEERGRLPRRVYTLTARGLASIRAAQRVFRRMTVGLEDLLEDPGT